MFTPKEHKIVITTLTSRRAWLKKNLEDSSIDKSVREENIEAIKLLDSALQKIAKLGKSEPAHSAAKASPPPAPPVKRTHITMDNARFLIAEDNADSAKLLLDVLQDIGVKVADVAKDGKEAFDRIKRAEAPYDIILCDWDMPELTGLEVHKKAKASNTLKGAHFIMVTAVSEAARIREAIQQGVNDYIVKPIDIDKLEGKIKVALGLADK